MRRIACATLLLAATAAVSSREAEAKYCPRVLYRATRLVLVTVPNMQATEASVRTFERNSPATRWEPRGDAEPAVVSTRGIAWGDMYESLAKKGTPSRAEIADVVMAQRAACVMLNKGPHILETVRLLDLILGSMESYWGSEGPSWPALELTDDWANISYTSPGLAIAKLDLRTSRKRKKEAA